MNSHSIGLYPAGYAVLAIERPLSRFRAKRLARGTPRRGIDTGWTCGLDSTPRMSGKTSSSRGVTRTKAGLGAVLALAPRPRKEGAAASAGSCTCEAGRACEPVHAAPPRGF